MRLNDIGRQASANIAIASRQQEPGANDAPSQRSDFIRPPTLNRQLERALDVAGQRADLAADSLQRATAGQEVLRDTNDRLGELQSILERAQREDLSSEDRENLQERFDTLIEELDGAQGQLEAAVPAGPGDAVSQVRAQDFGSLDPSRLGTGRSERFANVSALRDLDLSQANRTSLEDAAQVVQGARSNLDRSTQLAERRTQDLSAQRDIFSGVVQTLRGGQGSDQGSQALQNALDSDDPRLQRQAQAVQNMLSQLDNTRQDNPLLVPGSLFNFPA